MGEVRSFGWDEAGFPPTVANVETLLSTVIAEVRVHGVRVAIFSDIHANIDALDAVLADCGQVDKIICAGDILGYYADVNEVCQRLRNVGAMAIRGNHDAYVLGELSPRAEFVAAYRTDWTRKELSSANRDWLSSLPSSLVIECGAWTLQVRHASPWDEETYIYPDSPRLVEIALPENTALILGHTHHQMVRTCGRGLLINPGSVGQPRDWVPGAAYALFNSDNGKAELRRASYDIESLVRRLTELRCDLGAVQVLTRERKHT